MCPHQFDLDSIWAFIFGVPASSGTVVGSIHSVCTEAAFLLLAMLRSMLNLVRTATLLLLLYLRQVEPEISQLTPGPISYSHGKVGKVMEK